MDGKTFDALARGFGSQRSRRGALKGIAAGLLGLGTVRGAAAQDPGFDVQRVGGELARCGENCSRTDQCNAGLRCSRGRCIARGDSRDNCRTSRDCERDFEICRNRECVNEVNCGPDSCTRDSQCRRSEICRNGRCENDTSRCRRDNDCRAGEECRDDRCVQSNRCRRDRDCRRNEVCRNDRCEGGDDRCQRDRDCRNSEECRDNRCVEADRCQRDRDCRRDEVCRDNRCV